MRRIGCLGLLEKSWGVQCEEMVRELVIGEVDQVYVSTIRGRPDRWNAELWSRVYGFKHGGCGNTKTTKVPDWRVLVPNPDISG
jgi:hypothetical protein